MEEKKQNEDLQSRREFFKQAAKKTLPIIGGALLVNSSFMMTSCEDCDYGCSYSCDTNCGYSCTAQCRSGCSGDCVGGNSAF